MYNARRLVSADSRTEWWRPDTVPAAAGPAAAGTAGATASNVPFRMLMAFTFVLLLAPQEAFPVLAPFRIAMLTAVMAAFTHAYTRFAQGQPVIRFTRGIWIVTLLSGWAIMTIPLSYWPGGSVSFLINHYFKTLVIFLLLANVVDTVPRLKTIIRGLVLMSIPLALTTVKNFLNGAYMQQGQVAGSHRVIGYHSPLAENPNDMALMLNLILPYCVALFLANRRPSSRLFLGVTILLLVTAIIATYSRAGFLTLTVTFILYAWLLRRRPERVWAPLVLVAVCAAVPFVPSSYLERLDTITHIQQDPTHSAQNRWRDMVAATGYVIRHPVVGAGVGMNALAMNEARGTTWKEIHNVYLQYAVELGLPGLLLFLALMRTCGRNISRTLHRCAGMQGENYLYYITEGTGVSLAAFAVSAFFHPVAYEFYFYYIAGLALAVAGICNGIMAREAGPEAK